MCIQGMRQVHLSQIICMNGQIIRMKCTLASFNPHNCMLLATSISNTENFWPYLS